MYQTPNGSLFVAKRAVLDGLRCEAKKHYLIESFFGDFDTVFSLKNLWGNILYTSFIFGIMFGGPTSPQCPIIINNQTFEIVSNTSE